VPYEKPILLVDDEEAVLDLLTDYLDTKGYVTIKCTNPLEVLDLIRQHAIEVVILDYFMPKKNGLAVLQEINAYGAESGRPVQVIMLTAQIDGKVALSLLRHNAFLYMNKPPKFRDFLNSVQAATEKFRELSDYLAASEKKPAGNQGGEQKNDPHDRPGGPGRS
jgi:DNA-binding NtrC family response regulator